MKTGEKSEAINKSGFSRYLQAGINYTQYKEQMAADLATNVDGKIKEYITINWQRMQRVEKTFSLSPEVVEQARNVNDRIWWLTLTEHWCGDAAQSLPVLNKVVASSEGKIVMKLLYRDQNAELMDAFLTSGTRSIPKLIQLDDQLNVTGVWGPRPAVAQQLVKQLRANPATAPGYANELHLWYARDKQQSIEAEISTLLLAAK